MADAKITHIVWEDVKQAILNNHLVDSVRWWFSKRKIRSYLRQLAEPPQLISRRGFFGTPLLLLAPLRSEALPPHILKERIVAECLRTREGRMRLAQSMIQPIRRGLDYTALARRVFTIEQLPAGASVIYGRESDG